MEDYVITEYKRRLAGETHAFPRGFFSDDPQKIHGKILTRYLVEEILQYTGDEVLEKIRKKAFQDYKLGGMLNLCYRSSPAEAIMDAYPERGYYVWEFHETINRFYSGEEGKENAKKAIRWLWLEKLGNKEEDVSQNLSWELLRDHKLSSAATHAFKGSLTDLILFCFPETYEWKATSHVKNNYWTKEDGAETLRHIRRELQYSHNDMVEHYDREFIKEHRLYGLVQKVYKGISFDLLEDAFPGEFKRWEFRVPPRYWSDDTVKKAIRWLVEVKLKITKEEAKTLNRDDFLAYRLTELWRWNRLKIADLIEFAYEEDDKLALI